MSGIIWTLKREQRFERGRTQRVVLALVTVVLFGAWWAGLSAHDVPANVIVRMFARPEGKTLHLLVRVPVDALRAYKLPLRNETLLDLSQSDAVLDTVATTWLPANVSLFEEGKVLSAPQVTAIRLALPDDQSFRSYDQALAHFRSPPLPAETALLPKDALLDVMLEYPIASDRARFSIRHGFARLGVRVVTTLQFLVPGSPERAFSFTGDPGLVNLDPAWYQAALRFVRAGFEHILSGIDHLLFLFCLVLPLRRFRQLLAVVTAFTVAHSITLSCAAYGFVPTVIWFRPLIETLIAASIVYMALENIVFEVRGRSGGLASKKPLRFRWVIAFGFGLVHGFGFSFALAETLQFAGSHLITSLLSFNVGVELGQLLVLVALVPLLAVAFRLVLEERVGVVIASAVITHEAWHWMADRATVLGDYGWFLLEPGLVASALRWLLVALTIAGIVWAVRGWRRHSPGLSTVEGSE
jgi:HupE/UreJ protein